MAAMTVTANGVETDLGPVTQARLTERGPAIWLAGDPEDLKVWLPAAATASSPTPSSWTT